MKKTQWKSGKNPKKKVDKVKVKEPVMIDKDMMERMDIAEMIIKHGEENKR